MKRPSSQSLIELQVGIADQLAERLELALDLVEAWLHAAHSHELLRCRDGAYQIRGFVRWLLDAPEAPAMRALVDQAAVTYAPRLAQVPELMAGATRPQFGTHDEALRTAAASGLLEPLALQSLARVPGVRTARRVLDVGCGYGTYLAGFLAHYRDANGIGVELDASVAEQARRTLREAQVSRRGEIRVGDFMAIDLAQGSYDLVLLNHNLHYFSPEQRAALFARVRGCLAERGVFALQTAVTVVNAVTRVLGADRSTASFDLFLRCHANLHRLPDPQRLVSELREAGFEEVGEVPVVPGGSLRYVWARALQPRR
jgi:SAM-dependent methyltransferase